MYFRFEHQLFLKDDGGERFAESEKISLHRRLIIITVLNLTCQKMIGTSENNSQIIYWWLRLIYQAKRFIRFSAIVNLWECWREWTYYSRVVALI
jgi:hypothetical protein